MRVDQQFEQVNKQFAKVDQQFAKVDQQFAKVDQRFTKVDQQFAQVNERLAKTATREDLKSAVASMATKDDVKEIHTVLGKLLQLFPSAVHKEDRKVNSLVERLVAKQVFVRSEVEDLLDVHPLLS